jgi:deoxyribodipyrimidine photo-lyase
VRPIIVWFRRDLRTDDHAALFHASRCGTPIIPLFVFDTGLIRLLPSDGAAFNFQAEALSELAVRLEALGGRLITRRGGVMEVHASLLQEANPSAIYFNRDYEPSARERDLQVEKLYQSAGIEVKTFKDMLVHEPDEVLTLKGEPYVVFTPFAHAWKKLPHPVPFGKPNPFKTPRLRSDGIFGARELGKKITITDPGAVGGEREALKRWNRFLRSAISSYGAARDIPSIEGTSRMSIPLRFGCISVRRMLDDCRSALTEVAPIHRESIMKFVDELIWREFYQAVLFHYPGLLRESYRSEFAAMPWKSSARQFEAWKTGRTGFPMVDAGMRQLNQTGWMHNRVRMVVASFLTKDMRHDWRRGAAYFEEKLMDIETASNNGGWQWSASSGVDPKPLRIFNPQLQAERFDPNGEYIRKYVPELRNVPSNYIHTPHLMPSLLQKELGCVIGKQYPKPILDHRTASMEYKRIVAALKGG